MNQQNRTLIIGIGGVVVVVLLGALLGGILGPGVFGRGMMGWRGTDDVVGGNAWLWGLGMGLGGLMMVAFWGLLIGGIVLFARAISGQPTTGSTPSVTDDPLTILRRRYAAGEIDQPTYERMQSELAEAAIRPPQPVVANGRTEDARWSGAS